ncbi:MAG TPA: hypothetical protein VIB62_01250 [Actinomycetota bacterium]
MTRSAKLRLVLSGVLGVASFACFVRGAAYYVGTGPHDGEDLPSFAAFLVGAALLLAAVLIGWSVDRRRRGLWLVVPAGILVLLTFAWWLLNVELERWAS